MTTLHEMIEKHIGTEIIDCPWCEAEGFLTKEGGLSLSEYNKNKKEVNHMSEEFDDEEDFDYDEEYDDFDDDDY